MYSINQKFSEKKQIKCTVSKFYSWRAPHGIIMLFKVKTGFCLLMLFFAHSSCFKLEQQGVEAPWLLLVKIIRNDRWIGTKPKSQQKHICIWKQNVKSCLLLFFLFFLFSSHTFVVLAGLGTIKRGLEKLCFAPRCAVILSCWNLYFSNQIQRKPVEVSK